MRVSASADPERLQEQRLLHRGYHISSVENTPLCGSPRLRLLHLACVEGLRRVGLASHVSDSDVCDASWSAIGSTFLHSIFLTVTFCAFLAGSNIQYALLDATSPVIGISFVLILLRLNLNKPGSTVNSSGTTSQRGPQSTYPLRSININTTQHVDVDLDMENKIAGKSSCSDPA